MLLGARALALRWSAKACVACCASLASTHHHNKRRHGALCSPSSTSSSRSPQKKTSSHNSGGPHGAAASKDSSWERYYAIEATLGSGSFATVYEARDRGTGERVALKRVSRDDGCVDRETRALERLAETGGHPNVAGFRRAWTTTSSSNQQQQLCGATTQWFLATELVDGGELFEYLVARGAFSEKDAAQCFRGVFSAVARLHAIGVVHADLKPENLCLTRDHRTVKVIDFGSALLDGAGPEPESAAWRFGTAFYLPPEMIDAKLERDARKACAVFQTGAVDAWALGVVLYIALVGAHPFDPENRLETFEDLAGSIEAAYSDDDDDDDADPARARSRLALPLKRVEGALSPAAVDLLSGLLARSPSKRLRLEECLEHPWFHGAAGDRHVDTALAKNLARVKRFNQRLEATALDALVRRGVDHEPLEDVCPQGGPAAFQDALRRVVDEIHGEDPPADGGVKEEKEGDQHQSTTQRILESLVSHDYVRGERVFTIGDDSAGDDAPMYFIDRGAVEVTDKHGAALAQLSDGDFFGEGSMLLHHPHRRRSATVTVTSPRAHLVAIRRGDVKRLLEDARDADRTLREVALRRSLENAKRAIAAARAAKRRFFKLGEPACVQGERGTTMYSIECGTFDVLRQDDESSTVTDAQNTTPRRRVATLGPGDIFGEIAILDHTPRNATVVCSHRVGCVAHELARKDFLALLQKDPRADAAVRGLLAKRRYVAGAEAEAEAASSSSEKKKQREGTPPSTPSEE